MTSLHVLITVRDGNKIYKKNTILLTDIDI